MGLHEELPKIADELDWFAERVQRPEIEEPLTRLQEAAKEVGRASSGSWIGHHANVYYEHLKPSPLGAHFSQEWGLMEAFGDGTRGDWVEYAPRDVEALIRERAGNPDLDPPHVLLEEAVRAFHLQKSNISSILQTATGGLSDGFLSRLADELNDMSMLSREKIITILKPGGQFMTRDTLALGQGTWTPAHVAVLTEVLEVQHALGTVANLAKLARKAGSHLLRRHSQRPFGATVGTNVFIGHGRSLLWRELKDFIEDRLKLPVDEFNRVPVAGVTNIERLSAMVDAAAIALLVMTGEDEQPDGKLRARMNVVHEAGAFPRPTGFLSRHCPAGRRMRGIQQHRGTGAGTLSTRGDQVRLRANQRGVRTGGPAERQ